LIFSDLYICLCPFFGLAFGRLLFGFWLLVLLSFLWFIFGFRGLLFSVFLLWFFAFFRAVFHPANSSETPVFKGLIKKREKGRKEGAKRRKSKG